MYLNPKTRRTGFTLIELLVVIAIIAILAAMTVAVTSQVINRQRRVNTVNFFQSLDKILAKQVSAIRDRAMKEPIHPNVLSMAGGNQALARVIWVKLRLKQEFPQTFEEARTPHFPASNGFIDASILPSRYRNVPAAGAGAQESAICLYLALKRKRGGVSLSDDEVKPFVKTSSTGLPMFIDGWGVPIHFYRFPHENNHMDQSNPAPAGTKAARYRDPFDPDGLLLGLSGGGRTAFEQLCHPITSPPKYMIPTVVSGGRDENISLNAAMGPAGAVSSGQNIDNIYGYLVRSGGNGRIE